MIIRNDDDDDDGNEMHGATHDENGILKESHDACPMYPSGGYIPTPKEIDEYAVWLGIAEGSADADQLKP